MKIAINREFGGYWLSEKYVKEYHKITGTLEDEWCGLNIRRDDPVLIEILERDFYTDPKNGYKTNGEIVILEIPEESTDYVITDEDGYETLYYVIDGKIHMA